MEGYEQCMRSDKIDVQGGDNERNLFAWDTVKSVALCNRSRAPVLTCMQVFFIIFADACYCVQQFV